LAKYLRKIPDPSKGELKADPRFKYDMDFLKTEVCPALLNKAIKALQDLIANGIDYSCTEKAFSGNSGREILTYTALPKKLVLVYGRE
jgi:hypothetical protein